MTTITEIYQDYGNDVVINDAGDLMIATGATLSNQRIIRRLLTAPISVSNPPDYLANPTYGAGLPYFIGQNNSPVIYDQIKRLIISQMLLEETVSQTPLPVVDLTSTNRNGLIQQLTATITYTNVLLNQQLVVTLTIP
jgi:hypothetical protein